MSIEHSVAIAKKFLLKRDATSEEQTYIYAWDGKIFTKNIYGYCLIQEPLSSNFIGQYSEQMKEFDWGHDKQDEMGRVIYGEIEQLLPEFKTNISIVGMNVVDTNVNLQFIDKKQNKFEFIINAEYFEKVIKSFEGLPTIQKTGGKKFKLKFESNESCKEKDLSLIIC